MQRKSDVPQGTLDLLVLKTLSLEPMHGLGVSKRLEQFTRGRFRVNPGSFFPALHRMEQEGWITGQVGPLREQPAGEILRAHPSGKKTPRA